MDLNWKCNFYHKFLSGIFKSTCSKESTSLRRFFPVILSIGHNTPPPPFPKEYNFHKIADVEGSGFGNNYCGTKSQQRHTAGLLSQAMRLLVKLSQLTLCCWHYRSVFVTFSSRLHIPSGHEWILITIFNNSLAFPIANSINLNCHS